MTTFRVWAPQGRAVEVQVGGKRCAMETQGRGWWVAECRDVNPGTDYAYRLDGGPPLPDPRSPWQPQGVHGPSRVVDHSAYQWGDRMWQAPPLGSALVYELHVGTFTPEGTFDAIIGRLDHLLDLGVTHIELMPVNEFPGARGWGYDGVGLYAPHHAYGGPEGLKRLVDACHQHGLAVLLDVVYNHLGPSGNHLGEFGPYFTDTYGTPWGPAINLDGPGSDEVRAFLVDNALMWLRDYHFDGLRLDAVHAIHDRSAVHFLEELALAVESLQAEVGRHLVLIAESDLNNPRIVEPRAIGGYGLHAQWSDDFHHALHTVLTGERAGYYADFGAVAQLAKALRDVFVYDGCHSVHRGRRHGRPAGQSSGHRFLGYLQNHDQIGNRAQGERITALVDLERAKIGAALVLTSPFVPMLFQGEEWGAGAPFQYFTNHTEEKLARAVTAGRRKEFAAFDWTPEEVPDPQAIETFERSRLNWDERTREPHAGLLDWHRRLIRLRKATPDLTDGRLDRVRTHFDEQRAWLLVQRGSVIIAVNLGSHTQRLPLGEAARPEIALASSTHLMLHADTIELPGNSVAILKS